MKRNQPSVGLLAAALVLAGCASGSSEVNAYQHVLAYDLGRACVQRGLVRDMQTAAAFISFNERVINNRISAEKQAETRAFIARLPNVQVGPVACNQFELNAAEYANENAPSRQVVVQPQIQPVPRMRQALCTNIGGGMVACNSY